MAKRFNIYQSFANFLSERNNVSNEIAVVNTFANNFPKGALYCKGRLISKPQIPFAGVVEEVYQEASTSATSITNTNLYFLQDKNCFGIGNVTYANNNPDKLSFNFYGQYIFKENQIADVENYGLKYISTGEPNQFKLIPNEDFEYYVYNRPSLTYRVVGNPDEYFCKLHTDYQIKSGDYLLKDGTILPLEQYNNTFKDRVLGIVINPQYRSFLPYPVVTSTSPFMTNAFSEIYMNTLAKCVATERNGKNVIEDIYKTATAYEHLTLEDINGLFPAVGNGYNQSLCKMYIPTFYEIKDLYSDKNIKTALNNITGSNFAFSTIFMPIPTSTFVISVDTIPDYNYIVRHNNGVFIKISSNTSIKFTFFGNY